MKNILIIGIGGTGSAAVDIFYKKMKELGNQTGNNITALVFDTDIGDLQRIQAAKKVAMADSASVGTICDRIGTEYLKTWFPCDDKAVRAQEMVRGASQWRKKSYLAFLNLMNKPLARNTFISALEEMTLDPSASCEVYVIASVAGGTGSGSFIPIALYAKRYLRKNLGKDPIVNAMIALPDIYADSQTPENRIKVYSNAYAILRELNAINLVSRNYNAGVAQHKKAPIRFRIGDPREPNVGLLFDASDKQFWTPEAAPFSQVFLLDRIPGINSVSAHNMVLANSLYTILCTEIGSAFDSEFSNHELLRSQNNGSNAIYAGISTAQIRFPAESVLDYLAHQKTVDSCDVEWLTLHKAVENAIKEKERQAKAANRRYNMQDGEYAKIVLSQVEELEAKSNDAVISILERSIYRYNEKGEKQGKTIDGSLAAEFIDVITKYIDDKIPGKSEQEREFALKADVEEKLDRDTVVANAGAMKEAIDAYFQECLEAIKRSAVSTADAFLTLDKKKQEFVDLDVSIVERLLKKNGQYMHPVAAMIQLCILRDKLGAALKAAGDKEWDELKKRNVEEAPESFLLISENDAESISIEVRGKSAYTELGPDRFIQLYNDGYAGTRTNLNADNAYAVEDGKIILGKINRDAKKQLRIKVLKSIANCIDTLIGKYRNFFKRFEKEKEDLVEQTKTALRRDAGTVDSVINVYSSIENKKAIYRELISEGGPATDAEIMETDDIVGRGVFETVFNSAAAEFAQDSTWNDKDSGAYRSLFGNMVKAYRESIRRSEEYEKIAAFNAIEALRTTCGENADGKKCAESFKTTFSIAQDLATPSLRLNTNGGLNELVAPSHIMVFMMSTETGRYLKKHADELGLALPADQNNERDVIRACAEQFIRTYSGNNSARVAIVSSMPDQVLYCTGEVMDISPLRIAKFDELGEDNLYFKNYTTALANFKKYGTDMWNPHLGNDLHKRGFLPYMNEKKEKECDVKVVKALLWGFRKERILYQRGVGENQYFFVCGGQKITDADGRWINSKNAAQLINWLRNEDELVEEWSVAYDREVLRQANSLPNLTSDNAEEIKRLEAAITNLPLTEMLNIKLYTDPSLKGEAAKRPRLESKGVVHSTKEGPSAIEFAYMVKTSEENGRDCDDAERILDVLYSTFKMICDYRTQSEAYPDRFIHVYMQQLDNFYEALAGAGVVCTAGTACESAFGLIVNWLSQSNAFKAISADVPMDDRGNICIDLPYDATKAYAGTDAKKLLDAIKASKKNAKNATEE